VKQGPLTFSERAQRAKGRSDITGWQTRWRFVSSDRISDYRWRSSSRRELADAVYSRYVLSRVPISVVFIPIWPLEMARALYDRANKISSQIADGLKQI